MKTLTLSLLTIATGLLLLPLARSAEKQEPKPAPATGALFADDSLCKGTGVDVRRSQVDEAMLQFKANLNARGQVLPEDKRDLIEAQILERLVITQLLLNRATEQDRVKAKELAAKFVKDTREQAGSQEAFERQLLAMGFSQRQFEDQIMDRAISEAVVDRELKEKIVISDEQAQKYYDENGREFERPEMIRAAHILLSTRDPLSNTELTEDQKKQKKEQLEKLLARARKGEDFAALAREYSEDPGSKEKGGEYTFPRGQMMPEFEAAALSLKTNEISDVVITKFGYHIIKLYERMAARKVTLPEVMKELKDALSRQEVQKNLPDFVSKLKKDANVKYLNGAKPPEELAAPQGSPKPEAGKPK